MDKIRGTYLKDGKKLRPVCSKCQKVGEAALREKMGKRV